MAFWCVEFKDDNHSKVFEADKWSSNEDWAYFINDDMTQVAFIAKDVIFMVTPSDGTTPDES